MQLTLHIRFLIAELGPFCLFLTSDREQREAPVCFVRRAGRGKRRELGGDEEGYEWVCICGVVKAESRQVGGKIRDLHERVCAGVEE